MKKILIAVGAVACLVAGGVVVGRATSGTPEIDRANATMSLQGRLTQVQCIGEDSTPAAPVPYETLRGSYSGSQTQYAPDATDYSLTGKLKITSIVWTINLSTKRGVLTATVTLVGSTGTVTYKGGLWLITDGTPASGSLVPARGWINAVFVGPDDGVATSTSPNDDHLLANVEFGLATTGAIGQFGTSPPNPGAPPGYPDFSVVTNVAPPADGVC